jgi:hypothetical protein
MIITMGPPELSEGGGLFTIVVIFYSPPFKLNLILMISGSLFHIQGPKCYFSC